MPYGHRKQQEILNAIAIFDPISGRIGIYQIPKSIYEGAGFHRIYGWETASGSTGALQSGMFSTKPLTPDVRLQELPINYAPSANVLDAVAMRRNPTAYSQLGAEAYEGSAHQGSGTARRGMCGFRELCSWSRCGSGLKILPDNFLRPILTVGSRQVPRGVRIVRRYSCELSLARH